MIPRTVPDPLASNPADRVVSDGLGRIRAAFGVAGDSWGSRIVFVGIAFVYLLVYLVGIGDLWMTGGPGPLTVRGSADPLGAVAVGGLGRFGAIAVVYLGGLGLTYLFSPLNLLVALLIAGLVGANGALTYLGIRQRRLSVSTFVLAAVPPLLLLPACIGPTVIFAADVQVSSMVLIGLRLLVPISALLLVVSSLRISRRLPHHRE